MLLSRQGFADKSLSILQNLENKIGNTVISYIHLYDADGDLTNTTVTMMNDPKQINVTALKSDNGYHYQMKGLNLSIHSQQFDFKGVLADEKG